MALFKVEGIGIGLAIGVVLGIALAVILKSNGANTPSTPMARGIPAPISAHNDETWNWVDHTGRERVITVKRNVRYGEEKE